MKYRVSEIKLLPEEGLEKLAEKTAAKVFGNKNRTAEIRNLTVIRESVDARKKPNVKKVYTVDFECDETSGVFRRSANVRKAPEKRYEPVVADSFPEKRPVVTGFGPCGIFAALTLAEAGFRPLVIERGSCMETRVGQVEKFWEEGELDTESNVQFGEGGAGTFSDGKLTTNIKDMRCGKVLETFVETGADKSVLYKQKPHIGTDVLRDVVKNIREKIIENGGEILFDSRMDEIVFDETGASVKGIRVTDKAGKKQYIETDNLILAIGHSARDTFEMLYQKGVSISQKPFSIGVRVQHPQVMINRAQYGDAKLAELLGPADYKLSWHETDERLEAEKSEAGEALETGKGFGRGGRGVYTFCMCPGGVIVAASSEEDGVLTNGMSYAARDGKYANSAVLVDVRTSDFGSDHPLAGVEFQRKYEKLAYENSKGGYRPPETTWKEFASVDTVRAEKAQAAGAQAVINSLPGFAVSAIKKAMPFFGKKIKGFDSDDTVMKAVESRSSSPITMNRTEKMTGLLSNEAYVEIRGFYPAGEGAGHAGGIMSAAVDGIKAAEAVIRKYQK